VNPGKLRDYSHLADVTDGHIALQQALFILRSISGVASRRLRELRTTN
jgi:hypothetical protein